MIYQLKEMIENSTNIVFFGGAGVSTESNIPDFRSSEGLYNIQSKYNRPVEELLSSQFFHKFPNEFFEFYKNNLVYPNASPNLAHKALVNMEKHHHLKSIITQNIDGLHQKAGSKKVLELHGSVHRNYCIKCNANFSLDYILKSNDVPLCNRCGSIIKPEVVLYGEPLDNDVFNRASKDVSNADLLIVGGTSLAVYPAAGLLQSFMGKNLVIINKSKTSYDNSASLLIHDSIAKVLWETLELINQNFQNKNGINEDRF